MSRASVIYLDEVVAEKEDRAFRREVLDALKLASSLYVDVLNDLSEVYLLRENLEESNQTYTEGKLRSYHKSLKLLASMVKSCRDSLEKDVCKMNFLQSNFCLEVITMGKQCKLESEMYDLIEDIEVCKKEYKELKAVWKE